MKFHCPQFIVSLAAAALTLLAVLVVPGCTSPDGYKAFVVAADVAANQTIGPKYAQYVETDPALSPEQKATYLNELQAFRLAVAEAKKDHPSTGPP